MAGTYGGFVGVFTGVGIFIILCLALGAFIRFRQLSRKNAAFASSASTTHRSGNDFHTDPREHEEAFEMPRAWRGGEGAEMGNESTASFDPADVHGGAGVGAGGREEPFYSNIAESRSREVFFEPGQGQGQQQRYDDPWDQQQQK